MSEDQQQKTREAAMAALNDIDNFEETPEQPQEEPAPAPAPQEMELSECPRCGHNLVNREVLKPSDADIKEYFRCLMSGKIFSKNYALFDGELTLTYCLLSGDEAEILSKALRKIDKEDFIEHASQAVRLKLLFYLRRWGKNEYTAPETSELEELWKMWSERYGTQGEDAPVLAIKVMLEFIKLTELLPMAGLDETFYKGAGLS